VFTAVAYVQNTIYLASAKVYLPTLWNNLRGPQVTND